MPDKVTNEGRQAYQASLGGDEKARASLYVRKMKAKAGGYEYKVETTKHPFLIKILHIFTSISTKYFYNQEAVDLITKEKDRLLPKTIEPKKPDEKLSSSSDTKEQTKDEKTDLKKPVVVTEPKKEPQKDEVKPPVVVIEPKKESPKEEVKPPVIVPVIKKEPPKEEVKKPVIVPVPVKEPQKDEIEFPKKEPQKDEVKINIPKRMTDPDVEYPKFDRSKKSTSMKKEPEDDFPEYDPRMFGEDVGASEPPGIKTAPNIPKGWKLETYPTVGDGSCGVHALLGERDGNGKFRCDAKAVRLEYANWLRQKMRNKEEMPERIRAVLTDYFLHFKEAPGEFFKHQAAIDARQDFYPPNYSLLTHEEQDNLELLWLNEPAVLNTYINFLEDPSNDLRHDELLGFGEYFNKTVHFVYKNQWGNTEKIEGFENPAIEGVGPPVYIWYVPNIHFERATYTKI